MNSNRSSNNNTGFSLILAIAILFPFIAYSRHSVAVANNQSFNNVETLTSFLTSQLEEEALNSIDLEFKLNENQQSEYYLSGSDTFQIIDQSRIETFSTILPQLENRERTIIVYLPSDYSANQSSYPVIYLQAAQEVFIRAGSTRDWYLNISAYQFMTNAIFDEAIIIGVTYDFSHYWDEYSPWVNENMHAWVDPWYAERFEGGEGDKYLDFIVERLKPEIDHRYRTLPDRENTAISGYDMGGLISLYAGLTRSETFSKVIALSPAVWFAERGGPWLSNNHLIDLIEASTLQYNVTYYLDVSVEERRTDLDVQPNIFDHRGNKITYAQAYLEGTQTVMEALTRRGLSLDGRVDGDDLPPMWVDERDAVSDTETSPAYSYNFPLFFLQEMTNFNISMKPYLDRSKKIWVYLPPDYYTSDQSYPVLYVLDALRQFNPYNSSTIPDIDDWKTDEILNSLYDPALFKGIIVVGIEHHPTTYRWREYNRWTHNNMDNWVNDGSEVVIGESDAFVDFIVNKLKPTIDTQFRTLPDRKNTAIGGGSRAGYLAINAGLTHPETFSKVMAMSPAVWLAEGGASTDHPIWLSNNQLIKWIENNSVPTNVKFYLYIGGNETSTGGNYPFVYRLSSEDSKITYPEAYKEGAEAVRSALLYKGISPAWRYQANGEHHASYWRDYLVDALKVFGFYPSGN